MCVHCGALLSGLDRASWPWLAEWPVSAWWPSSLSGQAQLPQGQLDGALSFPARIAACSVDFFRAPPCSLDSTPAGQ